MKVIVLGSGVIGTTSAWHLAQAGHEVTVIDRQDSAGKRPATPMPARCRPATRRPGPGPGVPVKGDQVAADAAPPAGDPPEPGHGDDPLGPADAAQTAPPRATRSTKGRMVRLAEYSRDVLREMRAELGLAYDERSQGTLQLFRTQKQLDGTGADIEVLKRYGVRFELLDRAGCIRHEPALARVQEKVRRRPAAARRRDRRLLQVHASPGRARRAGWRELPLRHLDRRPVSGAAASPASSPTAARSRPTPTSSRWAATRPSCCADRHRHPGLSGQGLLDHRAHHRCQRCARNPP